MIRRNLRIRNTVPIYISAALAVLLWSSALIAQSKPDSIRTIDWSVVYRNRLDILFTSGIFPWNDEEASSQHHDRFAFLFDYRPIHQCNIFLKASTGYRGEQSEYYENWIFLEQGHVGFRFGDEILDGRIFLREKVYRTGNKLLPLVSNDSPFIDHRGEGFLAEFGDPSKLALSFTGATLRDYTGGFGGYPFLPYFHGGGDTYNLLYGSYAGRVGWLGFLMSETRSTAYGGAVMGGADAGLRFKGISLVAELARTGSGRWEGLQSGDVLSESDAFSAELLGLRYRSSNFGSLGLIPGYRFYGDMFIDPQGEIDEGLDELYATLWWRHHTYDIRFSIDAANASREGGRADYGLLYETLRLRFIGDLVIKQSAFLEEGRRGSLVLSLIDENAKTRVTTSARLDDLGGGNVLSFFAEGGMNVGKTWTFTTALYLHKSKKSYYFIGTEFRPGKRFLFGASVGSFDYRQRDIMLNRSYEVPAPDEEKRVLMYARIWLGDL